MGRVFTSEIYMGLTFSMAYFWEEGGLVIGILWYVINVICYNINVLVCFGR